LEHPYLSTPSGYYQIYSSGGVISNRGIEAVLFGKVLASPRIAWDVSLSLWGNRNRLLKFDSAQQCFDPVDWQCLRAGYPVGGYWTFPIKSEERRVGKECRSRWSPDHEKKKIRSECKRRRESR